MKAVIIEDEKIAAQSLKSVINQLDASIEVLAILQTVEDSVEWLTNNQQPDLLFVDIHLADGSSFSIFDKVKVKCPIIFTTAYDEYALKAFEVNSIDYLLKPINKDDLQRALNKYKNLSGPSSIGLDLYPVIISLSNKNGVCFSFFVLDFLSSPSPPNAKESMTYVVINRNA